MSPFRSNAFIRFPLPRDDTIPVHYVKCNAGVFTNIRSVFKNCNKPIEFAPEGQTSYQSESSTITELSTVLTDVSCASDLERVERK